LWCPEIERLLKPSEIMDVLKEVGRVFDKEKIVVEVDADEAIFVGDIHGDINAATRIYRLIESTNNTFIFLGDYVDRGPMGVEVAIGLFRLKIREPERIILLRGNHETTVANESYGFLSELQMKYHTQGTRLYNEFNMTFSKMPIAAIINSEILAMHGGIPKGYYLEHIKQVEKGDIEGTGEIILQVLWNDPDETIEYFAPSIRGPGVYRYGHKAFEEFMEKAQLKRMIRAHTFLIHGAQWYFNKKLLSLFSSIDYIGYKVKAKIAKLKNGEIRVLDLMKI